MLKPSGSSAAHPFARQPAGGERRSLEVLVGDLHQVGGSASRGTTSACPRVAGLMSMKATVCSSESTIWAGTSPATIPQKRQSLGHRARQPIDRAGRIASGRPARARPRPRGRRPRPRTRAASISPSRRPELGARLDAQLGGQLVAADRRARRARRGASRAPRRSSRGPARGGRRSPPAGCARPGSASRSATVSRVTSTESGSVARRYS